VQQETAKASEAAAVGNADFSGLTPLTKVDSTPEPGV
jgi:hypothetical protein